ncbi:LCP family glycopolymer transferase [Streptomyces sp. NPDC003233]
MQLSKSTHPLKGEAALEFVRSRHGFADGSDLGRTISQYIFLSTVIRAFKSGARSPTPPRSK